MVTTGHLIHHLGQLGQLVGMGLVLVSLLGWFPMAAESASGVEPTTYGHYRDYRDYQGYQDYRSYRRPRGSSPLNRGHEHQRLTRRCSAREGRPRCLGGVHRDGGTRNDSSSRTVQQ